jgi:DNA-binding response OmpR family regulator
MQAILVADDHEEKEISSFILRRVGLSVASSSNHERVLKNWTEHPADLFVVALSEEKYPLEVVKDIRRVTQIPILLIVDPQTERVYCKLLKEGADIVLERPISSHVLAAQSEALMRRATNIPNFVLPSLELEEISLDPSTRRVVIPGKDAIRLTQLEFRLLYTLMTNRGQVLPLEVLVERTWGYTGEGNQELVRGLVSRLRRKIEPSQETRHFIETVPGVGYRFTLDSF